MELNIDWRLYNQNNLRRFKTNENKVREEDQQKEINDKNATKEFHRKTNVRFE